MDVVMREREHIYKWFPIVNVVVEKIKSNCPPKGLPSMMPDCEVNRIMFPLKLSVVYDNLTCVQLCTTCAENI